MNYRRFVAAVLAVALTALAVPSFAGTGAKPNPVSRVNINTASVDQLTALPGVGPKLAARIVEHRQKSGAFKTTQELLNVRGIGEKNYAHIEQWLTVSDAAKAPAAK